MLNKKTSIIVGIILILVIGVWVYTNASAKRQRNYEAIQAQNTPVQSTTPTTNGSGTTTTKPTTKPTGTTPVPTAPTGITLAVIAQHSSRTSCWSAINGTVYDLTSWIPNHPGGEQNILRICGGDGSDEYNGQHGGSRRTASILAGFKIGPLAQ